MAAAPRVAVGRVALQGVQDDFFEHGREFGIDFARRGGIAGEPGVHHHVGILALEERRAGGHFVENGAQAVNIGALVAAFALDLFGRHVIGRAHGRGEADEGHAPGLGGLGDAKIHDANGAVPAEHDVLRFEIAVDDVLPVQVVQGVADPAGNGDRVGLGQRFDFLEQVGQGAAFQDIP